MKTVRFVGIESFQTKSAQRWIRLGKDPKVSGKGFFPVFLYKYPSLKP
ncbi:hypothetical protein [Paenibacillus sp. B2(2019)]|nr:hypothetical protein [Paenibacillus sp. B2(2019)]